MFLVLAFPSNLSSMESKIALRTGLFKFSGRGFSFLFTISLKRKSAIYQIKKKWSSSKHFHFFPFQTFQSYFNERSSFFASRFFTWYAKSHPVWLETAILFSTIWFHLIFSCNYCCIYLKRQSDHSALHPDTSSLVNLMRNSRNSA